MTIPETSTANSGGVHYADHAYTQTRSRFAVASSSSNPSVWRAGSSILILGGVSFTTLGARVVSESTSTDRPSDRCTERPSEEYFERLAQFRSERLLNLIENGLRPADLTFAAEIAGRHLNGPRLMILLKGLLGHPKPVVREGALYGLACHLSEEGVAAAVETVSREDPNVDLRTIALDLIEGLRANVHESR